MWQWCNLRHWLRTASRCAGYGFTRVDVRVDKTLRRKTFWDQMHDPDLLYHTLLVDLLYFMVFGLSYFFVALESNARRTEAMRNGRLVMYIEDKWLHTLDDIQYWDSMIDTHYQGLAHFLHVCYLHVFYPWLLGMLAFCWYHMNALTWRRFLFFLFTCLELGMVMAFVFPCAPPRMFFTSVQDVNSESWDQVESNQLTNAYSAFPSLHTVFVAVISVGSVIATLERSNSPGRPFPKWVPAIIGVANGMYSMLILGIIVTTGAHFVTDALGSFVLMGVVGLIHWIMYRNEKQIERRMQVDKREYASDVECGSGDDEQVEQLDDVK